MKFAFSYLPMEHDGFGYDPITDDYKLGRIVYLYGWGNQHTREKISPLIHIFSLRTGVWRTIPDPGSQFHIV